MASNFSTSPASDYQMTDHEPTCDPPQTVASSSTSIPLHPIPPVNSDHPPNDSALSLDEVLPDSIAHHDDHEFTDYDNEGEGEMYNDNDSAFGGSMMGWDSDSLASYITDYRYENGRRYHAYRDGEYWGPNDETSNDLQDLAHHMYLITLGGRLHLAPIVNPHNILDLGTGTGIWAIEMADAYPSAHVIGTDLSPIQPLFVPPNCAFEIEDFNLSWSYPENYFDFIHIRELFGCVTDWDEFFAEAFTHTKPGGYVEIMEHSVCPISDDETVDEDSFFMLWGKTVIEMGERFGKSFTICQESKERVEKAGFKDVVETRYKWPMNGWPSQEHRTHGNDGDMHWKRLRELGVWNQLRLLDGIEGFMIRLLTVAGGWSYEDSQAFLERMRHALKDLKVHAYLDVRVVYGRKPGGKPPSPGITPTTSGFTLRPLVSNLPEDYQGIL